MTDRELLEFIAAQVGNLTQDVGNLKQDVGDLKQDVGDLKQDVGDLKKGLSNLEKKVDSIDKTVIRIENDHGSKLAALFDGYNQNSDKLERIENEVTKQEEIIMRRIK